MKIVEIGNLTKQQKGKPFFGYVTMTDIGPMSI